MNKLRLKVRKLGHGSINPSQAIRSFEHNENCCVAKRHTQHSSIPVVIGTRNDDPFAPPASMAYRQPDARFEVLGSTGSLLSVSLSALQNLYARRGTLVALNGQAKDVISSLSILEPIRRTILGIPFLYQRISSTSPFTALLSPRDSNTSFSIVHLDGTTDWMIMQRKGLVAWTGQSLTLKPRLTTKLGLAKRGDTIVSGRGILALAGKGQIFQVDLKEGEEYMLHPSNILAFSLSRQEPLPYRIQSTSIKFQVPSLLSSNSLYNLYFIRHMRASSVWKVIRKIAFSIRTWARRVIMSDRLFLQFEGPSTILFQSRASRLADVITDREINEIAVSSSGKISPAESVEIASKKDDGVPERKTCTDEASRSGDKAQKGITYAIVEQSGKVKFDA